ACSTSRSTLYVPLLLLSFGFSLERHPEGAQERQPLLVVRRRRRDRDVQAADTGDLVVVDLGEDDLLADSEREVAAAVHRARVQAAKVADARQGNRDQAVEELPHSRAAQGHARADGHPLAHLEPRYRLPPPRHVWPLPRASTALCSPLAPVSASPPPMLSVIFSSRGTCIVEPRPSSSFRRGRTSC